MKCTWYLHPLPIYLLFSLYFLTQTFFNFPRRFELLGVNCSLALCIHFSCCKGTVFTIWINHKTRIFPLLSHSNKSTVFTIWINHKTRIFPLLSHSNKMHLLALLGFQQPKWQIFLPFHVLQIVKSLPSHRPEACTRYPFQVEPPCIGHYGKYPQDQKIIHEDAEKISLIRS